VEKIDTGTLQKPWILLQLKRIKDGHFFGAILPSTASCETVPIVIVGGGRVRMKIKNKKGFSYNKDSPISSHHS
jgi:hypothetical protein